MKWCPACETAEEAFVCWNCGREMQPDDRQLFARVQANGGPKPVDTHYIADATTGDEFYYGYWAAMAGADFVAPLT